MTYEIHMSNGDQAEATTILNAMAAALTMYLDSERSVIVDSVKRDGRHERWATSACRVHVEEQTEPWATLTRTSGSA